MSVPPSKHIYFFLFCCLSANILLARTDSYRCMWRDDPATTMTVGWNQLSGQALMLYYDVVDHGTNTAAYAHAHEPDRVVSYRNMNNHFVRLEGLQPATIYYFVIEDTDGVSKRFSFQTASDNPYAPLSIVAGGDSRNHRSSRQNANRLVSKLRPHVVFFGGDMTGGDTGKEWIDWMQDWQLTITKDGRLTPIIAARGNHEASNKTIVNLFDVPTAGVYFGLNFHGDLLRAYTLNSLIATGGAQRDWLKEDLHNSMHTRWRMAQYHYPTRPHTRVKRDRDNQMQNWSTLFHEHQVRLVVECDGHVVKTTYPVRPSTGSGSEQGFVRDDEQGTVYIGEGCWGAPLRRNNDDKHWTRNSGSFNQFKWIFVHYDYIEARTIKTDNADQVAAVDPNNIFSIPNGLNVWNPSNGDVVTIPWREQQATLASNRNWTSRSPFEVVNFETEMIGGDVYIQWTARNENSSTSYEIQRSLDGQSFTTIASIRPQLKALRENIYKLTDRNQTSEGALSYRLKSVNASGNITYLKPSHKITISHKDWEGASEILPDPNTGLLKIKYKLEQPGNVTIRMVNLDQKEISNSQYIDQRVGN
ncbi:MAG: metallophosphoesterase family protein, partial [Bacteroidota bacterium]